MNKRIKIIGSIISIACICGGTVFLLNTSSTDKTVATKLSSEEKPNGWNEEENEKYYYEDNVKKTGWLKENGKSYFFGTDGKMKTGWIKDNDNWFYMNDDGTMAVNTTVYGCYLNEDGMISEEPKKTESVSNSEESKKTESPSNNVVNNSNSSKIKYVKYENNVFGFSIDYPADFIPTDSKENGEGKAFKRSDGKVCITVYGANNTSSQSVEYYYKATLNNIKVPIDYKALNKDNYAVSYVENGEIKYMFFKLGKGSMNVFSVTYPESEQKKYDEMVEYIYTTFKTPGIDEAH